MRQRRSSPDAQSPGAHVSLLRHGKILSKGEGSVLPTTPGTTQTHRQHILRQGPDSRPHRPTFPSPKLPLCKLRISRFLLKPTPPQTRTQPARNPSFHPPLHLSTSQNSPPVQKQENWHAFFANPPRLPAYEICRTDFSKTGHIPKPAPTAVTPHLSTFPSQTVTAAGLNNLLKSFLNSSNAAA